MFQFAGFAFRTYEFSTEYPLRGGFPHSEISGSKFARNSPKLIAACYVLHRLSVPRHPPNALLTLEIHIHAQGQTQTARTLIQLAIKTRSPGSPIDEKEPSEIAHIFTM